MSPPNPSTVETLLAEHAWVQRIARTLVRDAHTADDLAQQTLATALRSPPENAASPRAWLATVLRNASRKRQRADSRRTRREHAVARRERLTSTAALVERAEIHERVVRGVLELEEPYRSTVLLRFFESLPPRAIATRQGVPVETVRTRLKRAMAKLRERFEAEFGGDRTEARRALVLLAAPPAAWGHLLMAAGAWTMALKSKVVVLSAVLLLLGSGALVWTLTDREPSPVFDDGAAPEPDVARATLKGREKAGLPGTADASRSVTAVAGRVLDASGSAVPGVSVQVRLRGRDGPFFDATKRDFERAFSWPEPRDAAPVQVAKTDARGAYRIEGLVDGLVYELRAVPGPPSTGTHRLIVARAGRTLAANLVALSTTEVRGRVVDAEGAGTRAWLTGRVRLEGIDRRRLGSWELPDVTTDADGRFVLRGLPPGELRLAVTAPGRRRLARLIWDLPVGEELVIRLGGEGVGEITGRVLDSDGQPIEGAQLMARGGRPIGSEQPPYGGQVVGLAVSDADGRYRIDALPDSPASLQVLADGFVVAWPLVETGVNLRQDEPLVVDVTLVRSAALRGVVRTNDGGPIEDAFVFVRRGQGRSVRGARTDAEGRYLVEDLAPGAAESWAAADGYWLPGVDDRVQRDGLAFEEAGLPLTLSEAGATVERDFILRAGHPVGGRVVDPDGGGVEGAVVRAQNGRPPIPSEEYARCEVVSDAQGRFTFPGLAPRPDWRVSARRGTTRTAADVRLDLTEGASAPLVLTLAPTFAIVVRVIDTEGDAIPAAHVTLDGSRPPPRADAEGRFVFERVPQGAHVLALTGAHGMREVLTREVVLTKEDTAIEIEAPAHYVTTGVLVDPTGEPVSGVWIELQRPLHGFLGSASPDAAGRFTIHGLPPGEAEVIVNGIPLSQTLEAGARNARLIFEQPAETVLRGTVWGPDGQVVTAADLLVRRGVPPQQTAQHHQLAGQFEVHFGGPPGRFDVAVVGATGRSGKRLDVRPMMIEDADLSRPLEFRLRAGRLIRGVVVDAAGQGVEGIRVKVTSQASRDGRTVLTFPEPHRTTDAEGRFVLVGLLDGRLTVETDERAGLMRAPPVALEAGEEELRVILEQSGPIAGIVLDPEGRPIAGASVGVGFTRADGGGTWTWPRTDPDGRFTVSVPRGAAVRVTARARPYAFETLADVAVGTNNLVLRGIQAPTIEGEVVGPDGEPTTAAYVVVLRVGDPPPGEREMAASADLSGGDHLFRAGPLEAGPYRVIARARSGPYLDSEPQIVSAPAKGVVLTLGRGRVLKGRLLGEDLSEFRVTWLAALPSGLVWRRLAVVGPSGAFTLDTLRDEKGVIFVHRDGDERCARVDDLHAGQAVDPIRLVKGLAIRGRVDQTGSPSRVNRPQVWAKLGGRIVALTNADDDGAFALRGLPPGRYSIGWGAPGSEAVEADAGAEDVVLRPAR